MEEAQIKQIIERQPLHGSALLDPRCKILLLVCIGFVSYFLAGEVVSLALMLVYGLFIALGNGGKWAVKMIVTYIIVAYLNALLRYVQVPVLSVIMSVFGVTVLKLIPIMMMGLWILRTTYMDDLMVALQRMRLPQAVTIPLVVMFRYIPTLRIEYRQIRSTMDIRGISDTVWKRVSHLLSSLVLLAFMFYLNWQLGLIAAIVTILAWLVSKGMNKVSLREAAGRQEQSERLTDAVLSFVEGIGVIKSYNLLGEKSEELSGNFKRSRNTSLDFERKMTPWTMELNILYGIGIAAIFGLSIVLEQSGALSLAYVLGVLLFVFDLFGPLKALYGEASRLTVMNAALDRIEAVLDEPELSDTGKQHIPAQAQPGQPEVQFNDVTFAYQDKEVLHHISFAMKKNSMTALVGPSGSGKSTIANLLARLWDVKSGNVTIRGVDIRNVPLSELMDQISMVFQRVYLFQDTIYNNISMGKPDATEEEVYEAARKARCYDFIMALPDGFQTVVGEGGATLSGGEKQRISIARCILKDAPIVILDEATPD